MRALSVLAVMVLAVLGGCESQLWPAASPTVPAQQPAEQGLLYLLPSGSTEPVTELEPTEGLAVDLLMAHGGAVRRVEGTDHQALRFPEFGPIETAPRTVVRVSEDDDEDRLTPLARPFVFGADFRLDVIPEDADPNDGDNLIQRGLIGQGSQFKIEVDGRRPSCRVSGADGAVQVRLDVRVDPESWYRVRCERQAEKVTLTLTELLPDGGGSHHVATGDGPTGRLSWEAPSPLSVGGKIAPNGEMVEGETDQFNGWIARPILAYETN